MKKWIIVTVIVTTLITNILSVGNDGEKDSLKTYKFEDDVITATQSPVAQSELPFSTSIISKQEIEMSSATKVMDLLEDNTGVFVQKKSKFGRADIDVRGIGNNGRKIMVLVDSRPVKMGIFGCTVTHSLPLDNVQRIELVKGPSSVLYGSDALGGVINIITEDKKSNYLTVNSSYGSFNTRKLLTKAGINFGSYYFNMTGSREKSDGHRQNDSYHTDDINFKFGGNPLPNLSFYATGKYFDGYKKNPGEITSSPDSFGWGQYYRSAFDLKVEYTNSSLTTDIDLNTRLGNHLFSDGFHVRDTSYGAELKVKANLLSNLNLITGYDYRYRGGGQLNDSLFFAESGNWSKYGQSIYALAKYDPFNFLRIVPGLRYNIDEKVGSEIIPQLGVLFDLNQTTSFRANASKGFKAPQLNELYLFLPANEDLKSEEIWTYELGMNKVFLNNLLVDLAVYKMEGSNLIQKVKNQSPPPRYVFRNTGRINFWGAETQLHYSPFQKLSFEGKYSFLEPGSKTKYRPKNKVSLKTSYKPTKSLSFILKQRYVSGLYAEDDYQKHLPEFYLADLHLKYSPIEFARISLIANNIFDRDYEMYENYPMPGRNLTGKVNVNIVKLIFQELTN